MEKKMTLLGKLTNSRGRNRSEAQVDDLYPPPSRSRKSSLDRSEGASFRSRAASLFGKVSSDERREEERGRAVSLMGDDSRERRRQWASETGTASSTALPLEAAFESIPRPSLARSGTAEMGEGELNLEHLDRAGYGEGLGLTPELIIAPGTPSGSEMELKTSPTQVPDSMDPQARKAPSRQVSFTRSTDGGGMNSPTGSLPAKMKRLDSSTTSLSVDTNSLNHDSNASSLQSPETHMTPISPRRRQPTTPASARPRSNTGTKTRTRGPSIAGALAMPGVQMALSNVAQSPPFGPKIPQSSSPPPKSDSNGSDFDYNEFSDGALNGMLSLDALSDLDDIMAQLGPGYAFASAKRNTDFHNLFKIIPPEDSLIEDYGCALQREILLQGRLYISEQHLCFHANIFGWVTNLIIPFAEVVTIEKRMTAFVIPNAIQISTLNSRNTFASFLSRDTTYDLISNIWKFTHPGVPFSAALPDTVEPQADSEPESEVEAEEEPKKKGKRKKARRKKTLMNMGGGSSSNNQSNEQIITLDTNLKPAGQLSPILSPRKLAHPATQCKCMKEKTHYKEVAMDATFPSPPEKIYNLMFTSTFMKGFWVDNQKLQDLEISDWAPEKTGSHLLARSMSYVKPLNAPVGPKSTKCHIKDETLYVDFDDYVSVLTVTKTPDVPSGKSFSVETRTCMMWARNQGCRVIVTTSVKWTGSSFIKGIIDRSAVDGQKTFHAELEKEMRAYIAAHPSEFKSEGVEDDGTTPNTFDDLLAPSSNDVTPAIHEGTAGDKELLDSEKSTYSFFTKCTDLINPIVGFISDVVNGFGDLFGISLWNLAILSLILTLIVSNVWTLSSLRVVSRAQKSTLKHLSPAPIAHKSGAQDFFKEELTEWLRKHDLVPVSTSIEVIAAKFRSYCVCCRASRIGQRI
ncbi:hypothetical protein BT69DRAFT_850130 [Atractiella rhizophila]|nr:hypothetical protein BT69DRAFT_850130 [Atractiella rhizophila]